MHVQPFLKRMIVQEASDLYLTIGSPPALKCHGRMELMNDTPLTKDDIEFVCKEILTEEQLATFKQKLELNLAISLTGIGRFRASLFVQRNNTAIVIRNIKTNIPTLEELNLPHILQDLVMSKNGLILIVGATGTGKSTTLASMINHRNTNESGHIITIEDPIEFIHKHKKSIVNQREVGVDTESYDNALQNTLRQAPDLILIGEIRNRETMQHALSFAETGHLCLSTLHANNANQTLDRVVNFFPQDIRPQILLDLSLNLRAIISQRLIPSIDGKRVAAFEILICTPLIKDLIVRGEITDMKEIMERSENQGMQTFDTALVHLVKQGIITPENAIEYADSQNNVRIKLNLEEGICFEKPSELQLEQNPEDLPNDLKSYRMNQAKL